MKSVCEISPLRVAAQDPDTPTECDAARSAYQQTVKELVNTEAKNADDDIAGVVGKVDVDKYLMPTLCERTEITHHAHRQQDAV